jgi:hypothetical protein
MINIFTALYAMNKYDRHFLDKLISNSSETNDNSADSSILQPVKNIIKDAKEVVTGHSANQTGG